MIPSMMTSRLIHFPLNSAYLCQDCKAVGNDRTHCPACASKALMGLALVLDRADAKQTGKVILFPARAA